MTETLDRLLALSPQKLALYALSLEKRLEAHGAEARSAPVAVVGAGLRLPGGVGDLESLWALLDSGHDPVGPIPATRWPTADFYRPGPPQPGFTNVNEGGFLDGIDRFDAAFFGISPREARSMDPQQRLVLEAAWEGLEHAAIAPDGLVDSRTGVYMGVAGQDYSRLVAGPGGDATVMDGHFGSGNGNSVVAGRLSHLLGLRGPAVAVDTACSSSLVASHLACQALRLGEIDMALAGGVNVMLTPAGHIALSQAGMLAPDGRCKPFDHRADGFVRSEGCGVVVLKRLADARADGDRILGVIAGTAVNQDGRSGSLTAPNGPSQEAVMTAALDDAGVTPAEVDLLETHGTGTDLGDPIEAAAAANVYGRDRPADRPLVLGAVKSVFGHMETAAGVGGLLKVLAALRHERIPGNLHLEKPSPRIPWDRLPLSLPRGGRAWPAGERRRAAGLSSFGYSGTNAHLVVTEPPAAEAPAEAPDGPVMLGLSARTGDALRALAEALAGRLRAPDAPSPRAVATTLARGRARLPARAAVVAETADEALSALAALAAGTTAGVEDPSRDGGVAFLFTGQGAQYPGMARALLAEQPAFREVVERGDAVLRGRPGWTFAEAPLTTLLSGAPGAPDMDDTRHAQPALVAFECAMAALWQAWGVTPSAVIGHSVGEIAAAVVAGALSLADGLVLAAERGALMADLPPGAMATVAAPDATVAPLLEDHPEVTIAGRNGPAGTTVAGPEAAVAAVVQAFSDRGLSVRRLSVAHAFHSPAMAPAAATLETVAGRLTPGEPAIPLASNLTGGWVGLETLGDPGYWRRHMQAPVDFEAGIRALLEDAPAAFLEMGPRPHLLPLAEAIAEAAATSRKPRAIATARRDRAADRGLAEAAAGLFLAGHPGAADKVDAVRGGPVVDLPHTPFERRRYWLPVDGSGDAARALLGRRVDLPLDTVLYESHPSRARPAWLDEHRVQGRVLLPGSGLLAMALAAGRDTLDGAGVVVRDVAFATPVDLTDGVSIPLRTLLDPDGAGAHGVRILSPDGEGGWHEHVSARVAPLTEDARPGALDMAALRAACPHAVDPAAIRQGQAALDLDLGPAFGGLAAAWTGDGGMLGRLAPPPEVADDAAGDGKTPDQPHPALVDAALQVLGAAPASGDPSHPAPLLPAALEAATLVAGTGPVHWVHAAWRDGETPVADLSLVDDAGRPALVLSGLRFGSGRAAARPPAADWLYGIAWSEAPGPRRAPPLPDGAALAGALADPRDALAADAELADYGAFLEGMEALLPAAVAHVLEGVPESAVAADRRPLFHLLTRIAADAGGASTPPDDPLAALDRLAAAHTGTDAESALVRRCLEGLPGVLAGGDPLPLLFPEGALADAETVYADSPLGRALADLAATTVERLVADVPADRTLRILEVGAGTGSLTRAVLPRLPEGRFDYCYTDVSPRFVEHGRERFGDVPGMRFAVLDLEAPDAAAPAGEPPATDGPFDLVLAANVLHATRDLDATIANLRARMAPGGALVLLEAFAQRASAAVTFGLTEGWWRADDARRGADGPLVSGRAWQDLLAAHGFETPLVVPEADTGLYGHGVVAARLAPAARLIRGRAADTPVVVLGDDAMGLADALADAGLPVATAHHPSALAERATPPALVIRQEAADPADAPGDAARAVCQRAAELLATVDAAAWDPPPRVVWITRGARDTDPALACLSGLLRVARREYPALPCTLIDLDPAGAAGDGPSREAVLEILGRPAPPAEVALRGDRALVPALTEAPGRTVIGDGPFRLDVARRGSLDGLAFQPLARRAPEAGEVEIAVDAVGLNFRDVLNTLGLYPGEPGPPGEECAGRVTRVGPDVTDLQSGDPVIAIASGCLASHVTVAAGLTRPLPGGLDPVHAAALPVACLTAAVALLHRGGLRAGERVLIHAGAGGVGLAAIHLAHQAGARVFATAHPDKWPVLRALGVEGVASSRTPGFAGAVRAWSDGAGVDVVLNSLRDPFIAESFDVLAEGGRFLEIGRRDIWPVEAARAYRPDVAYHPIMVADEVAEAPDAVAALYDRVLHDVAAGALPTLPVTARPVGRAREALAGMQAGQHVGRLVLDLRDAREPSARADGTYLVTGGRRGLGPHVGRWLAERGAGRLLLAGRRPADDDGRTAIAAAEAAGARVEEVDLDVTDVAALESLVQRIDAEGPPLRGIVHAAGTLADAPLGSQTADTFDPVLRTKVDAAWALHRLSLDRPVELFVLFSAGAALLGSPGQANHAAANAALDTLAHYRHGLGLPGLAVDWGPWAEAGTLADPDAANRVAALGMRPMPLDDGLEALRRALMLGEAQTAVLPVEWPRFLAAFPPGTVPDLMAPLAEARRQPARAPAAEAPAAADDAPRPEAVTAPARPDDEAALAALIRREAVAALGLQPDAAIPGGQPLRDLGLDSLMAVDLRNRLAAALDITLPATLAFDHPTVEALTAFLAPRVLATPEGAPATGRAPARETDAGDRSGERDIAVVGLACRLPGGLNDRDSLWQGLMAGVEGVAEVPPGRWDVDAYYDPDPDRAGYTYARHGGFMDNVAGFDAAFFGISPREAAAMDPQQRLLLEVAWEALEDAGQDVTALDGTPTGVFVGICGSDYLHLQMAAGDNPGGDPHLATGNAGSVAAGRIAYVLGLEGPALAVDTACSSSLVATHLARKSLLDGECDMALAGGVNVMLEPGVAVNFARSRMLSEEGRCRSFDADADGFVRGEGCLVVALKRLADARADGDPVLAVVRGSATNQDGRSAGLTAPNGPAQERVIRAALADAHVAPADVAYVEAHGSGTPLGDPIEATALGDVFAEGRPPDQPLLTGSVKTNLGHLEGAAGLAGLAKAVLAVNAGHVPPSLHFHTPNPHVAWDTLPVRVASRACPWPADRPRLAGVSSFGFSGTNAHMVVQEPPEQEDTDPGAANTAADGALLVTSARDPRALADLARRLADRVADATPEHFTRIALQAARRRAHHPHRLAVAAGSGAEAAAALRHWAAGETPADGEPAVHQGVAKPDSTVRVAFVFPGQGGQWAGMGRRLLATEPVFRDALRQASDACRAAGGPDVAALLEAGEPMEAVNTIQPALFALQVALAALLRDLGVTPAVAVGHSMGEVAAATVTGALDLADAARVICQRSRLLRGISGRGGMLLVGLDAEAAARAIDDHARDHDPGAAERVAVAVSNARHSTVLSGDAGTLEAMAARLEARDIFCRRVNVDVASHGPQVDPLRDHLLTALAGLQPRAPGLPMDSTVVGGPLDAPDAPPLDADYWWANLRRPVRFADAVARLVDRGVTHVVEMGPHPVLTEAVRAETMDAAHPPRVLCCLNRDAPERRQLLNVPGRLYVDGLTPRWAALGDPGPGRVDLPTYAWQHKRHWFTSGPGPVATPPPTRQPRDLYHTVWREAGVPAAATPEDPSWIVLGRGPVADAVAERLGASARLLDPAAAAAAPGFAEGARVLRLPPEAPADPAGAVESEIAAVRDLVADGPDTLWLFTRGGQAPRAGDTPDPLQAALWGLGRVAMVERPDTGGGLADLPPEALDPGALADLVLRTIAAGDGEDQVAWRDGRRFVPRLARMPAAPDADAGPAIAADGTWLITGGLGDIGLAVAEWLADRGARRLVLAGRRGRPDDAGAQRLAALEAAGCTVVCEAADVTRADDVARLVATAEAGDGPLRGIFHAAGVVCSARLEDLDAADIAATTGPKVTGTRLLADATAHRPPDWFVCFSTGGALWGAEGQGAYAAANAAMDAMMTARRARGPHGLSVNWGWWQGAGLVDDTAAAYFARMGFLPLPGPDALAALGSLMARGVDRAAAGRFDWPTFRAVQEARRRRPFLEEMEGGAGDGDAPGPDQADTAPAENGALARELAALPAAARAHAMTGAVARRVADVLDLPGPEAVEADRGFFQMGLDSVMAVRLRQGLETALGLDLPPSIAFEYPTPESLAAHLVTRLFPDAAATGDEAGPGPDAETPPADGESAVDLAARVADLDDDAIDRLLGDVDNTAADDGENGDA